MVAVEREDRAQQRNRGFRAVESIRSLRAQKCCEHAIAMSEIFVEEQHRRQGSREVVDLRFLLLKHVGMRGDAPEDLPCLLRLLQLFERCASPVGHVGDGEHAHLLEVACLPRGATPPAAPLPADCRRPHAQRQARIRYRFCWRGDAELRQAIVEGAAQPRDE